VTDRDGASGGCRARQGAERLHTGGTPVPRSSSTLSLVWSGGARVNVTVENRRVVLRVVGQDARHALQSRLVLVDPKVELARAPEDRNRFSAQRQGAREAGPGFFGLPGLQQGLAEIAPAIGGGRIPAQGFLQVCHRLLQALSASLCQLLLRFFQQALVGAQQQVAAQRPLKPGIVAELLLKKNPGRREKDQDAAEKQG